MVYIQITQVTPSWALQTTSGWADSYAVMWNAVMGHALATRVDSLRVGAAAENVQYCKYEGAFTWITNSQQDPKL